MSAVWRCCVCGNSWEARVSTCPVCVNHMCFPPTPKEEAKMETQEEEPEEDWLAIWNFAKGVRPDGFTDQEPTPIQLEYVAHSWKHGWYKREIRPLWEAQRRKAWQGAGIGYIWIDQIDEVSEKKYDAVNKAIERCGIKKRGGVPASEVKPPVFDPHYAACVAEAKTVQDAKLEEAKALLAAEARQFISSRYREWPVDRISGSEMAAEASSGSNATRSGEALIVFRGHSSTKQEIFKASDKLARKLKSIGATVRVEL